MTAQQIAEQNRYKENKDYRDGWNAGFQQASQGNVSMWGKARQAGYDEGYHKGYDCGLKEGSSKTKTTHEGKVEKSTMAYIKELKKTIEKQYKKIQKLERKKNG